MSAPKYPVGTRVRNLYAGGTVDLGEEMIVVETGHWCEIWPYVCEPVDEARKAALKAQGTTLYRDEHEIEACE